MKDAWAEGFAELGLTLGLEHHDHAHKRTIGITMDKPDENGTVFIGDGCWGTFPREAHPDRWYMASSVAKQHIWMLEIDENQLEAKLSENERLQGSLR